MRLILLLPLVLLASCAEDVAPVASVSTAPADTIVLAAYRLSPWYALRKERQVVLIEEVYDSETCEHAIARAKADVAKGILRCYTFGYPGDMCAFNKWHSIMREEYGIEAEHLGCVVYGWESCYNAVMEEAIEAKYGSGIWKSVNDRVDAMCAWSNRYVNPEEPYRMVEIVSYREPVFVRYEGPGKDFGEYAGSFLRVPAEERQDTLHRKIVVYCAFARTGRLKSWKLATPEPGNDEYYDSLSPALEERLDRALRRASRRAKWSAYSPHTEEVIITLE